MPRKTRSGPALLTIKQVARELACSESTVKRLVRDGKLARPRQLTEGVSRWFRKDVSVYLYRLERGEFTAKNSQKRPVKPRKGDTEGA